MLNVKNLKTQTLYSKGHNFSSCNNSHLYSYNTKKILVVLIVPSFKKF